MIFLLDSFSLWTDTKKLNVYGMIPAKFPGLNDWMNLFLDK